MVFLFWKQAKGFFKYNTPIKGVLIMKTRNHFAGMALIAIITFALTACDTGSSTGGKSSGGTTSGSGSSTAKVQADTPKDLSFGTNCKVTISSTEKFTTAEWNTLCNSVVAAIENGYKNNTGINALRFEARFAESENTSIKILSNSTTYNCEVKAGDNTIYLKMSAIDTVDFLPALTALSNGVAYHQP
jgi:hypothetical protein